MGVAEIKAKNQSMAAHMVARGIYHGRRLTHGLSNVPNAQEQGSAAYRRRNSLSRTSTIPNLDRYMSRLNRLGRQVRRGVVSVENDLEAREFYDSHGFARPVRKQSRRFTTGKV